MYVQRNLSFPLRGRCMPSPIIEVWIPFYFPTRVGVILSGITRFIILSCIPHAGGGNPVYDCFVVKKGRYSPRGWGCSWHVVVDVIPSVVFPT